MPTSDWTPTVDDVGAILRARTKDVNGNEVGTFNTDTRPTGDEVTLLIPLGVSAVSNSVGADIPMPCQVDARYLAALRVAMAVELSYFPEQIGTNRSPYNSLRDQFNDDLKRLSMCITNTNSGGTTGANGPPAPKSAFPMCGDVFLIGRATRW